MPDPHLIQQLKMVRPAALFPLAPRNTLDKAAQYFGQGRVGTFKWRGEWLEAQVRGQGTYLVRLRSGDGGMAHGECNCPAFRKFAGPCKHVLAVLMTASHALNGSQYTLTPPSPDVVERTKKALLGDEMRGNIAGRAEMDRATSRKLEKSDRAQSRRPQLLLHVAESGTVTLTIRNAAGSEPLRWWDAPPILRGFLQQEKPEPSWVEELFEECAKFFDLVVEFSGEKIAVPRQAKLLPLAGVMAFDLDGDAVNVLLHGEGEDKAGRSWLRIAEHLIFDREAKRFYLIQEPVGFDELLRFRTASFSVSGSQRRPNIIEAFEIERFNTLCLDPDYFPGVLTTVRATPVEPVENTCVGRIEARREGRGNVVLRVATHFGEVETGHSLVLLRSLREAESKMRDTRTMAAKSRRAAVEKGFFKVILADSRAAHFDAVQQVLTDPALEERLHAKAVQRWLDDVGREIATMEQSLVADAANGRWVRGSGGFKMAARALLTLREFVDWDQVPGAYGVWELKVEESEFFEALPALMGACSEHKIALRLDDTEVEAVDLDIEVLAEKPAGIDWFELHPRVRCAGQTLPDHVLQAVLEKGFYRDAEGKMKVVSRSQRAALERLRAALEGEPLVGQRRNRGTTDVPGGIRVPRLRILDLLLLRKEGIRTQMPGEEAAVVESLLTFEKLAAAPLPSGLKASLRDYQRRGYDWLAFLYQHRFGACLADDMGLGKTLQTICLLGAIKEGLIKQLGSATTEGVQQQPHLIVLPPTLLFNWRREIEAFYPSLEVFEYAGPQRDASKIPDGTVVLTTYELVRRDLEALSQRGFDVIVFDEAQAIKRLDGRRSKAMRLLRGRFKVCLTGTPLENNISEYYSIIELALPGLFGDHKGFLAAAKKGGSLLLDRARPFVLRRTKERILDELPPKIEQDIYLEASQEQRQYYTAAVASVRQEVMKAFRDKPRQQAGIIALTALLRLRQICVSPALVDAKFRGEAPKLEHLVASILEIASEDQAALVFSQFVKGLDLVEQRLKDSQIEYLRMDGSTDPGKRKQLVASFQKEDGPAVFLISLKTGGAGLNLTRASHVFHLDPWWNPAVENQASDRAHRIGQKRHVFIHRLLMRHTVEEKMMVLKERKRRLFSQILGDGDGRDAGGVLTREDMEFLLDG